MKSLCTGSVLKSGGGTAGASGDGHEGYAEVGFGSRGRKGFVGWVGDSRV
uniref:Uncharacterized protein n=1 Tax=Candidatus Methanogaster sp. ANME-2c ERB4 TaxID=2759911 RepID=A0A7G9YFZ3_9EURY|nr:hypothetical protein GBMLOPDG_00023 [Methanosarcinales archaeon ANME-2c ERB4]